MTGLAVRTQVVPLRSLAALPPKTLNHPLLPSSSEWRYARGVHSFLVATRSVIEREPGHRNRGLTYSDKLCCCLVGVLGYSNQSKGRDAMWVAFVGRSQGSSFMEASAKSGSHAILITRGRANACTKLGSRIFLAEIPWLEHLSLGSNIVSSPRCSRLGRHLAFGPSVAPAIAIVAHHGHIVLNARISVEGGC